MSDLERRLLVFVSSNNNLSSVVVALLFSGLLVFSPLTSASLEIRLSCLLGVLS